MAVQGALLLSLNFDLSFLNQILPLLNQLDTLLHSRGYVDLVEDTYTSRKSFRYGRDPTQDLLDDSKTY